MDRHGYAYDGRDDYRDRHNTSYQSHKGDNRDPSWGDRSGYDDRNRSSTTYGDRFRDDRGGGSGQGRWDDRDKKGPTVDSPEIRKLLKAVGEFMAVNKQWDLSRALAGAKTDRGTLVVELTEMLRFLTGRAVGLTR